MGGPLKYGFLEITDEHIAKLKELSDAYRGWIIFDDEKGETFVALDEWLCLYKAHQNRFLIGLNDGNAAPHNSCNRTRS